MTVLSPGDRVAGKWRIVRALGEGGMGAVYEARHEVLGTSAALKFLHPELARKPGVAARFVQEARVAATLQSPHVARVLDIDEGEQGPWLVMELLVGETLQDVLDRTGALPATQALDFGLQILAGLAAAHALGVVHRDLKPDNVFVVQTAAGPLLKLLDFGIAKLRTSDEVQRGLTRPGAMLGTPEYMAPEQRGGADRVDERADLYAVGVLLYEMFSGARPLEVGDDPLLFPDPSRMVPLDARVPSLPRAVVEVVHRCLSLRPEERPASAQEVARVLAGSLGHPTPSAAWLFTPAPAGDATSFSEAAPGGPAAPPSLAPPPSMASLPSVAPPLSIAPVPSVGPLPTPGAASPGPLVAPASVASEATAEEPQRLPITQDHTPVDPVLAGTRSAPLPTERVRALPAAPLPGTTAPASLAPPPPAHRRRRSGWSLLPLALLGALAAGGAGLWFWWKEVDADVQPPPPLPSPTPPPTLAAPPLEHLPVPVPGTRPTSRPTTTPVSPPRPRPDAGAADAGGSQPFPPLTMPSGLPPLPTLPIPSGLPTFPLPGWGPPPGGG